MGFSQFETPLPSTTRGVYPEPVDGLGYDVSERGEANATSNKSCFAMENHPSHHTTSPFPSS
jgi:hypothetical protein